MRYIRCCVEETMNSMTAITFDHAKAMALDVLLNDIANLTVTFTGFHNFNCFLQRFVCDLNQILVFLRHISDEECLIQITMESTMVNCHINIAQVTVLQNQKREIIKWKLMGRRVVKGTCSGRVSGIPWQMTSLTDVQHEAGKL